MSYPSKIDDIPDNYIQFSSQSGRFLDDIFTIVVYKANGDDTSVCFEILEVTSHILGLHASFTRSRAETTDAYKLPR